MTVNITEILTFKNNFLLKKLLPLNYHHNLREWLLQYKSAPMYIFTNAHGATPCTLLYVNYTSKSC